LDIYDLYEALKITMKNIDYSIVIPIFNESEIIPELWRRLSDVLDKLDGSSEVIFINDGSVDNSFELLKEISQKNQEVKIINFSRNFGHQCALSAGIDHANGKAVILMDGDLQDSPEAIISFSRLWQQGYDVVYAIRKNRKEKWLKRLAFKSFYYIQRKLSGIVTPMDAGIFSLMDRKVILTLRQMPERNKYLSGLRAYAGFKQIGVYVERGPRYRGEPKVSVSKLFKLAFDGIFSFSTIPLKMATILGLVSAIVSFIIGLIGLYVKFVLGQEFLSWAYGLTTTFFMGGVQLLSLGIIGEYIGRIYDEVRQRPYYIINEKIGFEEEN
ncbi:glycosyltransferase family 2 protein, partial [Hydrocoleum sp. CS-953]|uniref:glycosyltransferase family 2 protein n=1 Tax=Hydrocoleum sp. CS-953 TaxID=1671698 RepID=UPI00352B7597